MAPSNNSRHFGSRLLRPWPPKYLIVWVVLCVVLTRGGIILTSHDDLQMDLSIYQEVGELVVNGIDPYDFDAKQDQREALRLNGHGAADYAKADKARYDYFVSSNLPASTALYGLIEFASNGSLKIWRLALALGDVAIALAAFFFLRRAGVALDTLRSQILFSLATIFYLSAVQWGLLWAEDKQFQTALMLLLAGLLVGPPKTRNAANAIAIGAIGCLSVLFKAFGIFLAPLALYYFYGRPRRELVLAIFAAAVVLLPFALTFDLSFIRLMLNRTTNGLAINATAFHGSPWQLVPLAFSVYARPVLSTALIFAVLGAYLRGKIDLLNLCSAICLIADCLWVVGGSMDRMNIAMVFAMFCTATLSVKYWQTLTLFNLILQLFIYAISIARTRWLDFFSYETPDAIATAAFLASYFALLVRHCMAPAGEARKTPILGSDQAVNP